MINTQKILQRCLGKNERATEGYFRPNVGPSSQKEAILIGRVRAHVMQRAGGGERYNKLSQEQQDKLAIEGLNKYNKNKRRKIRR